MFFSKEWAVRESGGDLIILSRPDDGERISVFAKSLLSGIFSGEITVEREEGSMVWIESKKLFGATDNKLTFWENEVEELFDLAKSIDPLMTLVGDVVSNENGRIFVKIPPAEKAFLMLKAEKSMKDGSFHVRRIDTFDGYLWAEVDKDIYRKRGTLLVTGWIQEPIGKNLALLERIGKTVFSRMTLSCALKKGQMFAIIHHIPEVIEDENSLYLEFDWSDVVRTSMLNGSKFLFKDDSVYFTIPMEMTEGEHILAKVLLADIEDAINCRNTIIKCEAELAKDIDMEDAPRYGLGRLLAKKRI